MDSRKICRGEGLRDAVASEELNPRPSIVAATLPASNFLATDSTVSLRQVA